MEFEYTGMNGALREFRVTGVNESSIEMIKRLAGYPCFVKGSVIEGSSNKSGYLKIEQYVSAQCVSTARRAAGMHAAQKMRVLVPSSFSDADVIAIIGGTATLNGRGVSFRINEDHPAMHGEHLIGHEGAMGQYAYYSN